MIGWLVLGSLSLQALVTGPRTSTRILLMLPPIDTTDCVLKLPVGPHGHVHGGVYSPTPNFSSPVRVYKGFSEYIKPAMDSGIEDMM